MLSVILLTSHLPQSRHASAVSRSLAALVPLAVDGLVRDVHVLAANAPAELVSLADDAGAGLHDTAASALEGSKSARIFLLLAGSAVDAGLADEIWQKGLLATGAPAARVCNLPQKFWHHLLPQNGGVLINKADLAQKPSLDLRKIKAPLRLKATLQI